MDIFRIVTVALAGCMMCLFISEENKTFRVYVAAATGLIILILSSDYLFATFDFVTQIAEYSSIDTESIKTVFKIIAIAYIAQFASDICTDAEQKSIAGKIELASKFIIIYVSLPILVSFFDLIVSIL